MRCSTDGSAWRERGPKTATNGSGPATRRRDSVNELAVIIIDEAPFSEFD